jgi:hypothetical protein
MWAPPVIPHLCMCPCRTRARVRAAARRFSLRWTARQGSPGLYKGSRRQASSFSPKP